MASGIDREKLDQWCEWGILILACAVLVFTPAAFGGVRASEFVITHWLITGIVALWLLRLWIAPRFRFLLPPTCWAILPFVGYVVWQYRAADVEYLARAELLQVILYAVFFLAIVNNLYDQRSTRILGATLVVCAMFIAMYGVYQWLSGSNSVWGLPRPGTPGRGSGTYVSGNHLAGLLEMVLPTAIALVVVSRFKALPRIGLAYAALVILVGIVASRSRAGWLATAVAVVVLAVVLVRTRKQIWATLAVLVVVGGMGVYFYPRVIPTRTPDNPTLGAAKDDIRFQIWSSAWRMWQDHPWVGVGPNHFDTRYRAYRIDFWQMAARPGHAHNDYLNTLVDYGLVGLVLVLLPIGVAAYGLLHAWRFLRRSGGEFRQKGGDRLALVIGPSIGLLAILVHSFFDFNMHIPANALVAVTLLAIVTTHWRFATERFWLTARWPVKLLATVALIGTGVYLSGAGLQKTREVRALREVRAAESVDGRVKALQRAFAVEPKNFETAHMIGEELRVLSFEGGPDYKAQAEEAIVWFKRAIELNRWAAPSYLRCGMALDWLERVDEASPYIEKAVALDPNHYLTRAVMGWHAFHKEDYEATIEWMNRSLKLNNTRNPMAFTYRDLAARRLAELKRNSATRP